MRLFFRRTPPSLQHPRISLKREWQTGGASRGDQVTLRSLRRLVFLPIVLHVRAIHHHLAARELVTRVFLALSCLRAQLSYKLVSS